MRDRSWPRQPGRSSWLLDGDPDLELRGWSVRRLDMKLEVGTIANAGRHHQLKLVRQQPIAAPGTSAARVEPHFAAPAAHRTSMPQGHIHRNLRPGGCLPWCEPDLGRDRLVQRILDTAFGIDALVNFEIEAARYIGRRKFHL